MLKPHPKLRIRKESFGYVVGNPHCIMGMKGEAMRIFKLLISKDKEDVIRDLRKYYKEPENNIKKKVEDFIEILKENKFVS